MEKFIYKNCDYLYYIDLKHNCFIRFSGNEKTDPMPNREGNDYLKAVIDYIDRYIPKEDQDMVKQNMHPSCVIQELEKNGYFTFTTGVYDHDGTYTRKHLQYQYFDKENQIVLLQQIDITKNYLQNKQQHLEMEKLKSEVITDYLTGIYNRFGCEKKIQAYLEDIPPSAFSAFLLIDLDNFKSINDHLGHETGDRVLQDVANILTHSFRDSDIIGRLGGDEFVVFMKNMKTKELARHKAQELLEKLTLIYEKDTVSVQISASIGISFFYPDGMTFQSLYETADKAMYYAKHQKKNAYYVYDDIKEILESGKPYSK